MTTVTVKTSWTIHEIGIRFGSGNCHACVWYYKAGRILFYLMQTFDLDVCQYSAL